MKTKKYIIMLSLVFTTALIITPKQSQAFPWIIVKEVVKKAIKAIDLRIQKLQNKTIVLQNAQKKLENLMAKTKLDEITEWAEKQHELYQKYYSELWKVKRAIATYRKVRHIIQRQRMLVEEYGKAYHLFRGDKHFSPQEITYMYSVYSGILEESMKDIDELMLVINSFSTQMTDGQRLKLITKIGKKIEDHLSALRRFNDQNIQISLQRSKNEKEVMMVKRLYGL